MINEDFRKRLRQKRKMKGWTSIALAQALQKPQNYISKTENGKIDITIIDFFKICNVLEITPKEFFDETYKTARYKRLYKKIENLEKEEVSVIQQMVNLILGCRKKN